MSDEENQGEEIDQEKLLDSLLQEVNAQAYQVRTAIDNNKLRHTLKYGKNMLDTLRTSKLTPSNYYHLYTTIFDEMQYIYNYFREEARRGRRMKDLYDVVQQCETIVSRLYLLICVASAYIETGQANATDIIFDLFNLMKGVQNPLRGLFCRFFFLKMIKDRLPDKGNEYEKPGASPDDSIKFILNNLDDMNRLWIRLNNIDDPEERIIREREREQLKYLVGENITRLSSLNAITPEIYRKKVLPRIIEILLDSKDAMSQQYLMECVIQAFPDEYNIEAMNTLLETSSKLESVVDIKTLFISLMEKLAKYVTNLKEEENIGGSSPTQIFNLLKGNIDKIIRENQSLNIQDNLKLIELESAFLKFAIKCSPKKDRLYTVNNTLGDCVALLNRNRGERLNPDGMKLIGKLLSSPLESQLSIFDMPSFPELMKYLNYSSRATLSLRIIDSLMGKNSEVEINSSSKMTTLVDFIRPLFEDSPDSGDFDQYQFEYEQSVVCKVLYTIKTNDPQNVYDILNVLKNAFVKGGKERMKVTLPALVSTYLNLAYSISNSFAKNNNIEDNDERVVHNEFISKYDLRNLDTNDLFNKFIRRVYTQINDTITLLENENPELAFKLYLQLATQANNVKVDKITYEEVCYSSLSSAIQVFNSGKMNNDAKVDLLNEMIGSVLNFNILGHDNFISITSNIVQAAQTLIKRGDQCIAILSCVHLFCNGENMDKNKVNDCLVKAKRFADFAMTNPQNAILFIYIINKYVYLIDKFENIGFCDFIVVDTINDLIELVKNHIHSMKIENKDAKFLPEIEEYYNNTLSLLRERKKGGMSKILLQVNV
jgi:vacuolar protein sorting-associated protein 35